MERTTMWKNKRQDKADKFVNKKFEDVREVLIGMHEVQLYEAWKCCDSILTTTTKGKLREGGNLKDADDYLSAHVADTIVGHINTIRKSIKAAVTEVSKLHGVGHIHIPDIEKGEEGGDERDPRALLRALVESGVVEGVKVQAAPHTQDDGDGEGDQVPGYQ
jgi:hypothetical protein